MDPIDLNAITDEMHVGPFHAVQRAAGASFYEDFGNMWTKDFGDPEAEYWAVRRSAGLWDISALIKLHLTGSDVLPALDRLTTRSMLDARPGTVRYGMVLDDHGIMLDEGTSLVLSSSEAYFMGNDGSEEFRSHLKERSAHLDVQIEDVSESVGAIAVQGPRSLDVLSGLTDVDITDLRWFRLVPELVEIAGVRGLLVRAGFTGERGYEFYLLEGDEGAEQLWTAIEEAGAQPIGLDAIEMLRVEAGLVIADEDYVPGETNPYDLSLDRFIDLDGHDFVGRASCVATAAAPPRRFVTLAVPDAEDFAAVPDPGDVVNGNAGPVGFVTSAVTTPRFGVLALAVIDTEYAVEGTSVEVAGQQATVRSLPIDDPEKSRPRG